MPVLTDSPRTALAPGSLLTILTALLVFQGAAAASPALSACVPVPDFEDATTVADSAELVQQDEAARIDRRHITIEFENLYYQQQIEEPAMVVGNL